MKLITYFIALVLIVLGASFAALNASSVEINFYWSTTSMPLSLIVALAFVAGGLLGMFVCVFMLIKQKALLYSCKRKLQSVEKELINLRSIPIKNNN